MLVNKRFDPFFDPFYRSITLLKNLASIAIDIEGDEFGKIFEYFLGKFDFVMSNFPAANN